MTRLISLLLGFCFLIPAFLSAQNNEKCLFDQKMEAAFLADPDYQQAVENDDWKPQPPFWKDEAVVIIPVHVIIVHPPNQAVGSGVNFSMAHIQSQIDVLNEDFRRTNADAPNTPAEFPADDVEIEFCLANTDPNGNPTNGVTRYATTQSMNSNEMAIKSATRWDRNFYLNIWSAPNLGGILGWAYLPSTTSLPNATLDGAVIASGAFGGPGYGTASPYDLGRTATHEVGHYLGLYHIWRNNGCNADDNVADTPKQDDEYYGCPNHPSSTCGSNDMFMNYMDYVDDNCMNAFTTGQGTRMHNILNTSRSSLLNSAATNCAPAAIPLTLALTAQTNISCNGGNDGMIIVQANGGSGTYTYSINGGPSQPGNVFSNLQAGTYDVMVDDGNGNTANLPVVLTEPDPLVLTLVSQIDVDCFGNSNGSLVVNAQGGTAGYNYSLNGSPYSSNSVFTNLSGGAYAISVKDVNNCETNITATIIEPSPLASSLSSLTNVDCFGNANGEVVIAPGGGTPNYTYAINQSGFQNSNTFTGLTPGNYIVTTMDANLCMTTITFDISEPDSLDFSIASQINLDCFGNANGEVVLNGQGGTPGYQYSMDNISFQTNPNFSNLESGIFDFYLMDANGCIKTLSTEITAPEELIVEVTEQTNVNCFGENNGSVTINSSGGAGNYQVEINGETQTGNEVTFSNLAAGQYAVVLTDDNNCFSVTTLEVFENDEVELNLTNAQNISCNGANNGMIEVQTSGGVGSYEYLVNGTSHGSNNIFPNLPPDQYSIVVLDSLNCEDVLVVDIQQPAIIEANILGQTNNVCFGDNLGTISISGTGGTGALEFTLGNETNSTGIFENLLAGNFSVIISDQNGCNEVVLFEITAPSELIAEVVNFTQVDCYGNASGSLELSASGGTQGYVFDDGTTTNSTGVFENLTAGNYNITITDVNNCQTEVTSVITEPTELIPNIISQNNINCFGENNGEVTVGASGGEGNITFTLNGNSNSTGEFNGLAAGSYDVMAEDENGCETMIDVNISEPSELIIEIESITTASCSGANEGAVQVTANGGITGYQFTLGNETNNTGLFQNLAAELYEVVVTDGNNCTASILADVTEPNALNLNITEIQNANCAGVANGFVQISAAGGAGGFEYTLGNETNTSGLFQNLFAGIYNIIVTDASNCSSTIEAMISEPPVLEGTVLETSEVDCYEGINGSVHLSGTGGTGNLEFTLNGATNASGIFENLSAGIYEAVISDENNCNSMVLFEITEPPAIESEAVPVQEINCFGEATASFQITATGGVGNFEFELNGATNSTGLFENLSTGNYDAVVTDENGCSQMVPVMVTEPSELIFSSIEVQVADCSGSSSASVEVQADGGVGDYFYTLNNETNSTGIFENLAVGNYPVSVSDANGCSTISEVVVNDAEPILVDDFETQNVTCAGDEDGIIEVEASGGAGNLEFTLGNETNTTGAFNNLAPGIHFVIIEDANGCTKNVEFEITEPGILELFVMSLEHLNCNNTNTGAVQLGVTGGAGNYTFELNGETNPTGTFHNLPAGNFDAVVTDDNACKTIVPVVLTEPDELILEILENMPTGCDSAATGSVLLEAAGGVGGFVYFLDNQSNSTGVFENLPAGGYNALVTDGNGCSTISEITIEEESSIEVENTNVNDVLCSGDENGSVSVDATGGTGDLQFTLDNETNTTGNFENLPAGIHMIEIVDANNCSKTVDVEVSEPNPLTLETSNLVNDLGGGEGSVTLMSGGGAEPFTYSLDGANFQNENVFNNLSAGSYTGYVMDMNGCISETTFEIEMETAISHPDLGISKMDIFPNPFSENLIVELELLTDQKMEFELYSVQGQLVFFEKHNFKKGNSNTTFALNYLPAGAYILSIKNEEGGIGFFKIIKK